MPSFPPSYLSSPHIILCGRDSWCCKSDCEAQRQDSVKGMKKRKMETPRPLPSPLKPTEASECLVWFGFLRQGFSTGFPENRFFRPDWSWTQICLLPTLLNSYCFHSVCFKAGLSQQCQHYLGGWQAPWLFFNFCDKTPTNKATDRRKHLLEKQFQRGVCDHLGREDGSRHGLKAVAESFHLDPQAQGRELTGWSTNFWNFKDHP